MPLPEPTSPMLATAWPRPFSDEGWWFEPKWDGYRCLARWDGEGLTIRSRSGKDLTHWFGALPAPTDRPVVLDGEVVALDADGRPSFQALQRRTGMAPGSREGEGDLAVFVFDVLGVDDEDLRAVPLAGRLSVLAGLDLQAPWFPSVGLEADGERMWETVLERGLEGMVAKRLSSTYRNGVRSPDWRKIPHRRTAKAVVVGWTSGEGGRGDTFGSLVLAVHDDGLRWIGQVGTGFDDGALGAIREALGEMEVEEPPFEVPRELRGARWVEPRLVAHIEFREWTDEGRLRHPSFKGFGAEEPATVTWASEHG